MIHGRTEYYSTLKRKKLPVQTTVRKNLKYLILGEESQVQKVNIIHNFIVGHYCQNGKTIWKRNQINAVYWGTELTTKGHEGTFGKCFIL